MIEGQHLAATALAVLVAASLTACAAQHEESGTRPEAESMREAEADFDEPASAVEPSPVGLEAEKLEAGERSLEDMRAELAQNEARLRALGVSLGQGDADAPADASLGTKTDAVTTEAGGVGEVSGAAGTPGAAPKQQPSRPASKESTRKNKDKRADKKPKKKGGSGSASKPSGGAGGGDGAEGFAPAPAPRPDEAKAAPLPNDGEAIDAATRCGQICDLGQVTCELSVSICELADRHPDEEDYRSACERAAEDCELAQEACDACDA